MRFTHFVSIVSTFVVTLAQESSQDSACSKPQGNSTSSPTGPVFSHVFADPRTVQVDGTFYAYSTNSNVGGQHANSPVATSKKWNDGWELLNKTDVLPRVGKWTVDDTGENASVWGSSVDQIDDSHYVLYYSALKSLKNGKQHCVGAATGDNPLGPFEPMDEPLICPEQGSIDVRPFSHDGKRYLVYKVGGHFNPLGTHTSMIQIRDLDPTGTIVSDNHTTLITNTTAEYDTEGPAMTISTDGKTFFLFFVTGYYQKDTYAIQYTSAPSPLGPFINADHETLFKTGTYNDVFLLAPGAPSFINSTYMSFMTTAPNEQCEVGDLIRRMHTVQVSYNGDTVKVASSLNAKSGVRNEDESKGERLTSSSVTLALLSGFLCAFLSTAIL